MRTSYHVHTYLSDGQCEVAQHVRAALAAGLDELGVSDHYTLMPGKDIVWSMSEEGLQDYFSTINTARQEAGDRLVIRLGIEVDFIPGTADKLAQKLSEYPFDYTIGSIHFVGDFPIDARPEDWNGLTQAQKNEIIHSYWALIKQMAETRLFDIAGHLDLYKKFGHSATVDLTVDIAEALDAIADAGMTVELNTAGLYKTCAEAYPSLAILRECHKRGIPSLVTTDAHQADHLVRGYDAGLQQLRNAGYTQQAVFAERKMSLVDL